MLSRHSVQNTHMIARLRELHGTLLDIVRVMNQPQRDAALIEAAGIRLDRALFPLLVAIGRFEPIGVVAVAEGIGRDYTTVSRQVARLESLGLAKRTAIAGDRRVRAVVTTAKGRAMLGRVDAARERIGRAIFGAWSPRDLDTLARLMRRFADALMEEDAATPHGAQNAP